MKRFSIGDEGSVSSARSRARQLGLEDMGLHQLCHGKISGLGGWLGVFWFLDYSRIWADDGERPNHVMRHTCTQRLCSMLPLVPYYTLDQLSSGYFVGGGPGLLLSVSPVELVAEGSLVLVAAVEAEELEEDEQRRYNLPPEYAT